MRDVDGRWREQILAWAREQHAADAAILDLRVAGSLVEEHDTDEWSDVDLLLVVAPEALDRIAVPGWVAPLGGVWASATSAAGDRRTVRCVFDDGRWLDVVAATSVENLALTSRSIITNDRVLVERPRPEVASLRDLDNDLRFAAALAVTKIARNDLLIGVHLGLGLLRDCLVLAMLIRDREEDTDHHRVGGPLNDVANAALTSRTSGASPQSALALIEDAVSLWMSLALYLDPSYKADLSGLTALLEMARR